MTLVTGGAANVNTASLTVVTQPAQTGGDGGHHLTTGIITYDAGLGGHHWSPPLTFAYCAPRSTYSSAGNGLHDDHATYTPATAQYMGRDRGLYGSSAQ